MLEWIASTVRDALGGGERDDSFPTPPESFTDAEDRGIELRAYDGEIDALVGMYADFDPTQRAQGTPPVGEAVVRDWLEDVLTGPSVLAWHDDRVVGHVMFVPDGEGRHELAIFVHQDYQRAGIGSRLIRAGLGHAREQGVEYVWLSVESWKRGAQKLYRRVGFRVDNPMGATLRMSRRL